MDVCLMIEGQEDVTWEQWLALADTADAHGFHTLYRSDHYRSFDRPAEWGTHDAWATLAALAMRTRRIRLGTMVSPVTFRHPSVVAKSVITVDHASGGRVDLGMGGADQPLVLADARPGIAAEGDVLRFDHDAGDAGLGSWRGEHAGHRERERGFLHGGLLLWMETGVRPHFSGDPSSRSRGD